MLHKCCTSGHELPSTTCTASAKAIEDVEVDMEVDVGVNMEVKGKEDVDEVPRNAARPTSIAAVSNIFTA